MATEAEAVAKLAAAAGQTEVGDGLRLVTLPEGHTHELLDLESFTANPRRPLGTVQVHDADGFVGAVQQRVHTAAPVIYADEERMALVAVLNDDHAATAGWRDHRVQLALRRRPEWEHWRKLDGHLVDQEAFATHVEDGLAELQAPGAAVMLDLAQTFHATTSARFKGGHRISSGARQLVYEEEIDATAGTSGDVAIPDTIELAVRPFFGAERYAVTGRFRFNLRGGVLTLGYKLDRPDDVERAAFAAIRDAVATELTLTAIAGVAPAPRA